MSSLVKFWFTVHFPNQNIWNTFPRSQQTVSAIFIEKSAQAIENFKKYLPRSIHVSSPIFIQKSALDFENFKISCQEASMFLSSTFGLFKIFSLDDPTASAKVMPADKYNKLLRRSLTSSCSFWTWNCSWGRSLSALATLSPSPSKVQKFKK